MKLSAKTEYACLAMLELAVRYESAEPVRIRDVCEKHEIPANFLVQILLQLKGAGLVASTRGASGGYQLARPPGEISLGEVVFMMERGHHPSDDPSDASPVARVLHKTFRNIGDFERNQLNGLTWGALADSVRSEAEEMYYI